MAGIGLKGRRQQTLHLFQESSRLAEVYDLCGPVFAEVPDDATEQIFSSQNSFAGDSAGVYDL